MSDLGRSSYREGDAPAEPPMRIQPPKILPLGNNSCTSDFCPSGHPSYAGQTPAARREPRPPESDIFRSLDHDIALRPAHRFELRRRIRRAAQLDFKLRRLVAGNLDADNHLVQAALERSLKLPPFVKGFSVNPDLRLFCGRYVEGDLSRLIHLQFAAQNGNR